MPTQMQPWSPAPSHQAFSSGKGPTRKFPALQGKRGKEETWQERKEEERSDSAAWPVIGGLDCAGQGALLLSADTSHPPGHLGSPVHLALIISAKLRLVCWWGWVPPLQFPIHFFFCLRFVFLSITQILNKFVGKSSFNNQPQTSLGDNKVSSLRKSAFTPKHLRRGLPFWP